MYHPEIYVYTPVKRRGIELLRLTDVILLEAQSYRDRYELPTALGVTSPLDTEGIELFVARHKNNGRLRRNIDHSFYVSVGQQIDQLIEDYMSEYPSESSRPYQIQNGVNQMLTQADHMSISIWPRRARRTFMELGEHWRGVITGSK